MLASSPADMVVFGGAAGGGKSYALILEGARLAAYPRAGGIFFRRLGVELQGPGSLWSKSLEVYPSIGGASRESPVLQWSWPNKALIEMRHLEHESSVFGHQSKEYDAIFLDEGTHFTRVQLEYLPSRLRSAHAGFKPYMRIGCNPDPTHVIREWIDYYIADDGYPLKERAGKLRWWVRHKDQMVWAEDPALLASRFPHLVPKSFTFIPSKLEDNPILMNRDPGYLGNLLAMTDVDRERLHGGNWNIVDVSKLVYRFDGRINIAESLPPNYDVKTWIHILAQDFGYNDECSWVVLASHPNERRVWVLDVRKEQHQLPNEAADITAGLVKQYNPYVLVGDSGGLGKPYVEWWNRWFAHSVGIAMLPALKQEKLANVKALNGSLGKGDVVFVRESCQPLIAEIQSLRWADETRTREHPGQPNHCCDALLYGWRHSHAFLHEAPVPRLADRDRNEVAAWQEKLEAEEGQAKQQLPDWARF